MKEQYNIITIEQTNREGYMSYSSNRKKALFILLLCSALCGYLYSEEKTVVNEQNPFPEDYIESAVNLKAVRIDNGWGFSDLKGNVIIAPYFQQTRDFTEGLGQIKISGEWGFIDNSGKIVIQPVYKNVRAFSEGLAPVLIDNKWGFIDSKGKKAADFKYTDAHRINESLAAVSETGQLKSYGYITPAGIYAIKPQYDDAKSFTEGFAAVKSEGKWGYVNHEGRLVVPCSFEKAEHFSKGLAAVKVDNKWGYINPEGKFAIKPSYDFAGNFTDKGAMVSREGLSLIIDPSGKEISTDSELDYGDKFLLVNDAMCSFNGGDYPACITIVNFTSFDIWVSSPDNNLEADKIRGHVILPWGTVESSLFSRNPKSRKGEMTLMSRVGREGKDWKALCSLRLFSYEGNNLNPFGGCAASLINQFIEKKGVPAGDERIFNQNTIYWPNRYLVFNLEDYVWILVGDSWFGNFLGGYVPRQVVFRQPTLFLIEKKLVPDWEYLVGMK